MGPTGQDIYELAARLYPIARSLTGDGVRRTLALIGEVLPIEVHEVPTGTAAFDWTVPAEWGLREAYVAGPGGERVVDAGTHPLHVVGYSVPVRRRMTLDELRPHLHTLPDHPDWVPYRTSYYAENWGFCLPHRRLEALEAAGAAVEYDVVIDATLAPGHLTRAEAVLAGQSGDEVVVSTHICHPAMANDNASGMAVAALLGAVLAQRRRRLTYRFLFSPGTIGTLAWLSGNPEAVARVAHGLVLSNMGDAGGLTYKCSRRGDAAVDRAASEVLRHRPGATVVDFSPWGYDERQFCSPGLNLAVGSLSRSPHAAYPEYHTSADDLDLISPDHLADSLAACLEIVDVLETDRRLVNRSPMGEPQLGRRGLWGPVGGRTGGRQHELALLWVLNQSDGDHSLLDIAARSGLPYG
ncbi:MAG: DUF4910 domain-containing protein, partial [Acidimicrobiales bacterium]